MTVKNKEYYIVNKSILPESIQKVIEVNELLENRKTTKYQAIKEVGLSRGTYYKYKDLVKPFFEEAKDKVYSLYLSLEDRPGVLSKVLDLISEFRINILTIIQNIPINNTAHATIAIQVNREMKKDIETVLEKIKETEGVKDIRLIGNE